jgi:hypothetical protein
VIGKVFGRTYAFIGLERAGGIMVYDISNPFDPFFVDYVNTSPIDIAPEGLVFIKEDEVPTARRYSWSRMKSATRRAFSRSIRIKQNVSGAVDG